MIAVGVVVVAVAAFLVWSVIGKKAATSQYVTAQPTRGTLTVAVAGNGNVVSQNQASVSPGISGTVTQLGVGLGTKVKAGEVLFVINNASLDAAVTQAKAQVASSRMAVTKAQTTVPFSADGLASAKHSLTAAKAGQDVAQENYEHACEIQREGHAAAQESYDAAVTAQKASLAQYDQARTNANQRTVTSPIDGYVTTLSINNGDQIGNSSSSGSSSKTSSGGSSGTSTSSSSSNSTPIVISDLSQLQAQVQIAETDRPKVKLGQKVELTFDAVTNLTITGKVTEIDAVGTSSSGVVTYNVTISFDVQDPRLNPGMTASASIVTEVRSNVLMVPNAAIKTDSSGASYVQVLDTPTGTPRNVTVTTGAAGDTDTEITSGLTGNENVVTQTITTGGSSTAASRSGLSVLGGGAARGGAGGFRGGN